MKMKDAVIEWVPLQYSRDPDAPPGGVHVVRKQPDCWRWRASWLDIGNPLFWSRSRKPTETERVLQMFLDFHAMVVRDGIDPQALHAEMLKVDEYRQYIARDITGAEDKPDE